MSEQVSDEMLRPTAEALAECSATSVDEATEAIRAVMDAGSRLDAMSASAQKILDQQWQTTLCTDPPTHTAFLMAQGLLDAGYVHESWGA